MLTFQSFFSEILLQEKKQSKKKKKKKKQVNDLKTWLLDLACFTNKLFYCMHIASIGDDKHLSAARFFFEVIIDNGKNLCKYRPRFTNYLI